MSGSPTTNEIAWRVADTTARNLITVTQPEVGKLSLVLTGSGALYKAMSAGTGSSIWEPVASDARLDALEAVGVFAYRRTFAFDDAEIDVAAVTASIDIGDPLPAGAIVTAVIADITQDFSDGGAGVFGADVGVSGGDADLYTPTELNIDGGVALQSQAVNIPAGAVQLAVTFTGDVNLSTLTGGAVEITVFFVVPSYTEV